MVPAPIAEKTPFSIEFPLPLCQNSADSAFTGLFLAFLFCPIGLGVYLLPIPHRLDGCRFIVSLDIG